MFFSHFDFMNFSFSALKKKITDKRSKTISTLFTFHICISSNDYSFSIHKKVNKSETK